MSDKTSLVYKNINIYRLIMNVLYLFKYKKRFTDIINNIHEDKSVLELCFGDIYIAKYCTENNKKWTGVDINRGFVAHAKHQGYHAIHCNILSYHFQTVDVCIIAGSLYHFIDDIESLLKKMFSCSEKIIISEPIKNLSNNKYLAMLAKNSANAGLGQEQFRFNEQNFITLIDKLSKSLCYSYEVKSKNRDILVVLKKNKS